MYTTHALIQKKNHHMMMDHTASVSMINNLKLTISTEKTMELKTLR
jgi:hypothetical protein